MASLRRADGTDVKAGPEVPEGVGTPGEDIKRDDPIAPRNRELGNDFPERQVLKYRRLTVHVSAE
jgi:hypothetical protein